MHIQGVQLTAEHILESKNSLIECSVTIYIIQGFFFFKSWDCLPESGQHCYCIVTNDTTLSAVLNPGQFNINKLLCMLQYKSHVFSTVGLHIEI